MSRVSVKSDVRKKAQSSEHRAQSSGEEGVRRET